MSWLYFKRKNICCELQGTLVRVQLISSFTNSQVLKGVKRIKLVRREAVERHHRGRRWTDRGYMLDTNPRKLPQLQFVEPARDACD